MNSITYGGSAFGNRNLLNGERANLASGASRMPPRSVTDQVTLRGMRKMEVSSVLVLLKVALEGRRQFMELDLVQFSARKSATPMNTNIDKVVD